MKTMMPRASIVLLFGLAALTQIANAEKHYYVVTPKEMSSQDKAKSHVEGMEKWMKKVTAKQEDVNKIEKDLKIAAAEQTAIDALVTKARAMPNDKTADDMFTDAQKAAKTQQTKVDEEVAAVKAAEQAVKDKAKPTDDEKTAIDEAKAREVVAKAALAPLKKDEQEWKDFAAKAKGNWDAKKDDSTKDDACAWIKEQKKKTDAVTKLTADLTDANKNACNRKEDGKDGDGKPKLVDDPENGGLDYLQTKVQEEYNDANVDVFPDRIQKKPGDLKLEGFFGDAQTKTTFLISTEVEDLATEKAVQELFNKKVAASDGHAEESYSLADVKAIDAKDATPTVTTNHYVKIIKAKTAHMEHGALINRLGIWIEPVVLERQLKDKDGKLLTKKEDGKDVPDMKSYTKRFMNFQALQFQVYKGHAADVASEFEALATIPTARASDTYKVVGDFTALDKVAGANGTDGGSSEGKDGGSNTWKIVAIIFIVIVVLGGLFLGYQAYNASGSLQNTDI